MKIKTVTLERATDTVAPVVLIAICMSIAGKGFPSFWPVAACLTFSCIQPFFRVFLFDRIRKPLLLSGQKTTLLLGSAMVYGSLALVVTKLFI